MLHAEFDPSDETSATRAVLKAFENDSDLATLQQRIGRFSMFDLLGIERAEIRHSNVLAWLMDPSETHGQGAMFLQAVVNELASTAQEPGRTLCSSALDQCAEVRVYREWRSIDLLIVSDSGGWVIVVENKLDSAEHGDQLMRYERTIESEFPGSTALYVFLTPDERMPSRQNWMSLSHRRLSEVLRDAALKNLESINPDVRVFIEQYLQIHEVYLMEQEEETDELCRKIYLKHRRAIDLIRSRMRDIKFPILPKIESWLKEDAAWISFGRTRNFVAFSCAEFLSTLPPIGDWRDRDSHLWIAFAFECKPGSCHFAAYIGPTALESLRMRAAKILTVDSNESGFKATSKSLKRKIESEQPLPEWTCIAWEKVLAWNEDEMPSIDQAKRAIQQKLVGLRRRVASASTALQPIMEMWQQSQQ